MKVKNTILESLVDANDMPALIVSQDYRILAVNQRYCDSYSMDRSEILGKGCHEVAHHFSSVPCQNGGEDCPHRAVMETHAPAEVIHTHFDRDNLPDRVRIKAYPLVTASGDRFVLETIQRLTTVCHTTLKDLRLTGQSPAFLSCMETLRLASPSSVPVLLYGETGVGKEMAARCIHQQSLRHDKPFVELNCAAIPDTLFESEVFGHERGAFTGSVTAKPGLFELADKGTLFLDEIGELPLAIQAKLLRVLDSGEFRRVGGSKIIRTDVRLVTATNRNLLDMVDKGLFREDLYFRIAGFRVLLPPLRERKTDIPLLAQALIQRYCMRTGAKAPHLSRNAIKLLSDYDYPGNVRELNNILQRALAISNGDVISSRHIYLEANTTENPLPLNRATINVEATAASPPTGVVISSAASVEAESIIHSIMDAEARHIDDLLKKNDHNRRIVAKLLGISERTLYRKLSRHNLT
jgi:two-component system, NtrC family, response regulator AtoC